MQKINEFILNLEIFVCDSISLISWGLTSRNFCFSVWQFPPNFQDCGRSERKLGVEYYATLFITWKISEVSLHFCIFFFAINYWFFNFRKYAAAVFITNNRFETGKKRLAYLSFNDFVACSNQMIAHWSYSSAESRQDDMDVDVDREFLHNLKDLKSLLEKDVVDVIRV